MRTRRSVLSLASTLLFMIVTMTTALVTAPYLIHWLGRDRFGLFRTMSELFGYLTLLEFGLSGALAPLLAGAIGRGDHQSERRTMAVGVRAYAFVSILSVVGGLFLAATIPFWTNVPDGLETEARQACVVYSLGFLWLGLIPFRAAIEARQLGYVLNLLLTGQALIIASSSMVLAWWGWGIPGQALAILIGISVFNLTITGLMLQRNMDVLHAAVFDPVDLETRRGLNRLSGSTLAIQLAGRAGTMTDNIILGRMIDQKAVTILYFTQRLPVMVLSLLQGVSSATWAGLAELHASGEHETYRRRVIELSGMISILGVAALGPVVAYNRHFIDVWRVGQENNGGTAIVIVAAANTLLVALLTLWSWSFTATGQVAKLLPIGIVSAIFNVIASVVLTWRFGVIGPLLGTTVSFLFISSWSVPELLHRNFGVSRISLASAVLKPLACGIPYTILLWWVAQTHRPRGLIGLGAEMSLAAVGFLVLAGFCLLSSAERSVWIGRIRALRTTQPATSPVV